MEREVERAQCARYSAIIETALLGDCSYFDDELTLPLR